MKSVQFCFFKSKVIYNRNSKSSAAATSLQYLIEPDPLPDVRPSNSDSKSLSLSIESAPKKRESRDPEEAGQKKNKNKKGKNARVRFNNVKLNSGVRFS